MSFSVVVGAGGTGRALARLLAEEGERVRLVTRSGSGPVHAGVELVAADATDADRLSRLTEGAATLYNCAMPAYDRWPTDWPPLAAGMLASAERTGTDYVMLGNTYVYGPVAGPIAEDRPSAPTTVKGRVRAQMWADALEAHRAGRVRVTEVRACDFLGVDTLSVFNLVVLPHVVAGTPAAYPGDLDVEHSWTYIEDAARTMIAAARQDATWGRVWHVPSTSTLPVRALTERLAAVAGAPGPQLTELSLEELVRLGEQDSIMAELVEIQYLDREPHVLDSAHTETVLGVSATPVDSVLEETAREQLRVG
jgi:nucleoside-diphosphate-sugar epimerase